MNDTERTTERNTQVRKPRVQRRSVLASLRQLIPNRPLRYDEAFQLSELQANRCRELMRVGGPEFPEEALTAIPRIRIMEVPDLPSSGASYWYNGRWIIAVNGLEPWQRQRFSIAHELWHVINYTTDQWLCVPDHYRTVSRTREQLADYFAGCLLMPKQYIKRLTGQGLQPSDLADTFGVSQRAVEVRLSQLGLSEPVPNDYVLFGKPLSQWHSACERGSNPKAAA